MKPQTGIGPLLPPLKWPEYDQKTPSMEESGLPSPPNWHDKGFDDAETAPIGDYPRIRSQFAQLRDPFKYWDQQGRRDYGEILYDHDQYTDMWSIGPEVHWWEPFKHSVKLLGVIAAMGACVHWWDPEKHLWFAEKDYPFDGLRVELGGDPENVSDTFHRVRLPQLAAIIALSESLHYRLNFSLPPDKCIQNIDPSFLCPRRRIKNALYHLEDIIIQRMITSLSRSSGMLLSIPFFTFVQRSIDYMAVAEIG